eukprot:CAMPEP_0198212940 /NCGR_PEP_ID=MMETSP1445-20131203/28347_1 /TAXON_ID=36898 /ORGANISM="Pyramimonas sp., Strain CCMP2087" /LENGTH=125 /DNA_ID=CAMNT_0043887515 /DNA_START=147 /DNA_END=521 /DNA_ORIENTATION=+
MAEFNVTQFKIEVASQLGVPYSSIHVTGIEAGSVIISFEIQPADGTTISAAAAEAMKTTLDSSSFTLSAGTITSRTVSTPEEQRVVVSPPPPLVGGGGGDDNTGIIIGVTVGGVVLLIIVGIFVW